jgi:hypothetical protein
MNTTTNHNAVVPSLEEIREKATMHIDIMHHWSIKARQWVVYDADDKARTIRWFTSSERDEANAYYEALRSRAIDRLRRSR